MITEQRIMVMFLYDLVLDPDGLSKYLNWGCEIDLLNLF